MLKIRLITFYFFILNYNFILLFGLQILLTIPIVSQLQQQLIMFQCHNTTHKPSYTHVLHHNLLHHLTLSHLLLQGENLIPFIFNAFKISRIISSTGYFVLLSQKTKQKCVFSRTFFYDESEFHIFKQIKLIFQKIFYRKYHNSKKICALQMIKFILNKVRTKYTKEERVRGTGKKVLVRGTGQRYR